MYHLAQSRGVRIQIYGVLLSDGPFPVGPMSLYVGYFLGITYGLNMAGSVGRGGAEQSHHALVEAVTNWKGRKEEYDPLLHSSGILY